MARLANLSFASNVFPSRYKAGLVTLLLKKPTLSADDPAHYRSISNLHTFSKILDKLFLSRLLPQVMCSGHYCKFQSAYRKGHSTETELLMTYSEQLVRVCAHHFWHSTYRLHSTPSARRLCSIVLAPCLASMMSR